MDFIKYLDGGFSVIENLKVSGAREGKYGVTIIVSPNSTASAVSKDYPDIKDSIGDIPVLIIVEI